MAETLTLEQGSEQWQRMRHLATVAEPGRRSALYYLNEKILGHGEIVPMTPRAHMAMCLFAEGATGIPEIDAARIKMILVPRGLGKSTLVTKALPLQHLLRYDDWATGIANEKQDLANGFLGGIKAEFMTNELLRALWPERIPDFKNTTWASDRIVIVRKKPNPTSPSVLATGVGATVTGVHMNEWVLDDLLSQDAAENAYRGSFTEIQATNRWLDRIQPLLKSPKRDPIYIIGTRWWEGDTYEYAEEKWGHDEDKKEYLWQLRLPDGEVQNLRLYRVGEIAVFKRSAIENGRSIFPERYDLEELESLQQEDPVFFAGQYLLEPTAGAASEFDADWLAYYEWDAGMIRYRDSKGKTSYVLPRDGVAYISLDPAFSDSNSAARTAIPVTLICDDRIFLLEDFAQRGLGVEDMANKAVDFFVQHNPRKLIIETITAQVAVADAVKRVARERGIGPIPIEEIKSHGRQRKHTRIYGLEPYFRKGMFYIHRSHQNFIGEYTTFPRAQLVDILDALSMQREHWERTLAAGTAHGTNSTADFNKRQLDRLRAGQTRGGGY